MKYEIVLVVLAALCSDRAHAAAETAKELWDKNATPNQKQTLLVALDAIETALETNPSEINPKALKAGSFAMKVCGYDNDTESPVQGTVSDPSIACYKAANAAFAKFGASLSVKPLVIPNFLSGTKAGRGAAPAVAAPEPPPKPAKSISVGSDSDNTTPITTDKGAAENNTHVIMITPEGQ
jgi:hypothetical protein